MTCKIQFKVHCRFVTLSLNYGIVLSTKLLRIGSNSFISPHLNFINDVKDKKSSLYYSSIAL